jgi:hypothetical protein
MTTKQSARLHPESVNRDCFVVLPTLHHLSALLAMTRSGLFQQSAYGRFGGSKGCSLACHQCMRARNLRRVNSTISDTSATCQLASAPIPARCQPVHCHSGKCQRLRHQALAVRHPTGGLGTPLNRCPSWR